MSHQQTAEQAAFTARFLQHTQTPLALAERAAYAERQRTAVAFWKLLETKTDLPAFTTARKAAVKADRAWQRAFALARRENDKRLGIAC